VGVEIVLGGQERVGHLVERLIVAADLSEKNLAFVRRMVEGGFGEVESAASTVGGRPSQVERLRGRDPLHVTIREKMASSKKMFAAVNSSTPVLRHEG